MLILISITTGIIHLYYSSNSTLKMSIAYDFIGYYYYRNIDSSFCLLLNKMGFFLGGGHRRRMIVGFSTTYAISDYRHYSCEFECPSWWFSSGTLVSSTNENDHHDMESDVKYHKLNPNFCVFISVNRTQLPTWSKTFLIIKSLLAPFHLRSLSQHTDKEQINCLCIRNIYRVEQCFCLWKEELNMPKG